jgi:Tfp pilus assembly protein PilV
MLPEIWIPLLSALIGALIGALSSMATVFIQTRAASQRELAQLAIRSALEEYKIHAEAAKDLSEKGERIFVEPLLLGMYEMDQHVKLISSGKASPRELARINKEIDDYRLLFKSRSRN